MKFSYTYNGIERTTEISNKSEISNLSPKQISDLSRTFLEAISLATTRDVRTGFTSCNTISELFCREISKNQEPGYEVLINNFKIMKENEFTVSDILKAILNKDSVYFQKREALSETFSTMV